MHELSIAQNIVTIVVDEAKRAGAASVKTIRIRAGALRGIVREQLLFSFDFVKTGTVAEGATLEMETLPIRAACKTCSREFGVENYEMICPECTSKELNLIQGMELDVKEIEIE
jgi:hydrogenase nickel incorporation protein HypA/HybF